MVARAYADLGGIQGVRDNPSVDYSPRGNDKDRFQTFLFECDPADPLTALLHLQGSNSDPSNLPDNDMVWSDLVDIDITAEGGTFFIQTEVEVAKVRLVCKDTNYTSGRLISCRTMR